MTDPNRTAHIADEAPPDAQALAAREQSIERMQDELDTAAIDVDQPEPRDALDVPSQERLFEQSVERATRA